MSRVLYRDDGCEIYYSRIKYSNKWQYLIMLYYDGTDLEHCNRFEEDEVPKGMDKYELITWIIMLTDMYIREN